LRALMLVVTLASLLGIWSYQGDLANAEQVFWLKYFLSSQSAILWMSVLFFMGTLFYWLGMIAGQGEGGRSASFELMGSRIVWAAVGMALIGTMVRWYEGYLIGPDVGHIPVSNLYEVFVLFSWMTAAFYLYFEAQYKTRSLGAFVMLVVSAAVGFLLWYTVVREAHEIQPLVPALKSWWMKLHVPANFIGYGMFALAAMVALAYLVKQQAGESRWRKLTPLWLLGVALCFVPIAFRQRVAGVLTAVRRPLPDWWVSTWEQALGIALPLAESVAAVADRTHTAAEWKFDDTAIPIAGGALHIRGRIDLLLTTSAALEDAWLVDFKTGQRKGLSLANLTGGDGVQLALYALALRAAGLSVWIDEAEMGLDLAASMSEGIAKSEAVVVLASPDYAASPNCMFELRAAAAAGKPIVACCAEPGFWRTWGLRAGTASRYVSDSSASARTAEVCLPQH
jgi:ABC-type transport system involved in cytochrome c biogenesis permease subunit